ncbi:MAG TPA: hypothetical protein VFG04_08180 [Planctomycetaceae bacterium]|jgi:hypothetical protein|nr:hypothetical protein [Planctomycetaceae bacterium]
MQRLIDPVVGYFLVLIASAVFFEGANYWGGDTLRAIHYSVDTITLRGRITEDKLDAPVPKKSETDKSQADKPEPVTGEPAVRAQSQNESLPKPLGADEGVILIVSDVEALAGLGIIVIWFGYVFANWNAPQQGDDAG